MVVVPGTVVPGGSRNQAFEIVVVHRPTSPPSLAISVLRIVPSLFDAGPVVLGEPVQRAWLSRLARA